MDELTSLAIRTSSLLMVTSTLPGLILVSSFLALYKFGFPMRKLTLLSVATVLFSSSLLTEFSLVFLPSFLHLLDLFDRG